MPDVVARRTWMASTPANALLTDVHRASRELKRGRRAEAIAIYRDVADKAGEIAPVHFELGNLCCELGDNAKSIPHYRLALQTSPDDPRYMSALGLAYLLVGQRDSAREQLERAIERDPSDWKAQHGLGLCHVYRNDHQSAVTHLEQACELKPSDVDVRVNLTTSLRYLNRYDEALAHARKAVSLDESMPGARFVLAETLAEIGEMDEARAQLERLIQKHKAFGLAYELLARIRKFSSDDHGFVKKTEERLKQGMPADDRVAVHFALGKIYDDCADYDAAFGHFEQANLLQKRPYDFKSDRERVRDLQKIFDAKSLERYAEIGHPSPKPVFIVGMPRSGTTLMERIIASHPRGAGVGELTEIPRLAEALLGEGSGRSRVERVKREVSAEKIHDLAQAYLAVLERQAPAADRVVDKMPGNYYYVGLIKALFPNATIIHAIRNPLDTCLSLYFQSFSVLRWTNDPQLIAKVYRLYRKTMAWWQNVLPKDAILDVHYENLIEDPEANARRMIEACGLEWDSSVLEYSRNAGVIRTASVAQARQPIYKSSAMRWIKYADHIGPFVDALAPELEEDRVLLREHGIELPRLMSRVTRWLR